MTHEIKFCQSNETELLQQFFENSWKAGHILAHDENLLKWQYFNRGADRYNFAVAQNAETGAFDAALGYIPLSHFDPALAPHQEVWLSIWKNDIARSQNKSLGLGLLRFLERELNANSIGVLGATPVAERIYKALKFKTGALHHYALFNPAQSDFKIAAHVPPRQRAQNTSDYSIQSIDFKTDEVPEIDSIIRPHKSLLFLQNRYASHPSYSYQFFGIYKQDKLTCIWVTRTLTVEDAKCLRIVDCYGTPPSSSIQSLLENILIQGNFEYIDCLHAGLEPSVFLRMGFILKAPPLIVPNFFEPFEQTNNDLIYSHKSQKLYDATYHVFKGDSDQDRPNR